MMGWDGTRLGKRVQSFQCEGKTYFWLSHYIRAAAVPKQRYSGKNDWPEDGEEKCHIHIVHRMQWGVREKPTAFRLVMWELIVKYNRYHLTYEICK